MNLKSGLISSFLLLIAFQINNTALAKGSEIPLSLSPISTVAGAGPQLGSVISVNRDINLENKVIAKGSELVVGATGDLALVEVNDKGEATGNMSETGLNIRDLNAWEYTLLTQDEETGEILGYNIPDDFDLAGPGHARKKRSGVTNCFHVVKQLVRGRISLFGVAAYMAAPQLRAAGWRRFASYAAAPYGAICVFAAGGKRTASGGQIYGHVGVKGAGGVANPMSGFHLLRPFLGCWNEH